MTCDEHKDLHPNINQRVFFNPGSGPVAGATLENATANMEQYIKDSPVGDELEFEYLDDEEDGRFKFLVTWKRSHCFTVEIDMPGLPLEQVRWMGEPEQDIWDFPRLYVDGSSWVWKYAILD